MLCKLCQHGCDVIDGLPGLCKVRGVIDGRVGLLAYGMVTTAVVGPIEQKLIYHFRPGSRILSLGGSGCNMSCAYCQNFEISQVNAGGKKVSPSEAVSMATEAGAGGVAFSYNEPLVWYEYVMDVFRLAKDRGLATIMKTNGYCEDSIFSMVTKATDAINIDVKGPRGLYREVCGVDLPGDPSEWPMIRNLRIAHSECIDTEVSVVAIPGFYDDAEETRSLLRAIRDAAPRAPLHILRFIPDFRMRDTPPSSVDDMRALAGLASEFFKYVYLDFAGMDNDTLCPCGKTLVRRSGIEAKYSGCQCGAKVIVE